MIARWPSKAIAVDERGREPAVGHPPSGQGECAQGRLDATAGPLAEELGKFFSAGWLDG